MIKLDLTNLSELGLESHAGKIPEYIEKIEARNQDFYKIVDDESIRAKVEDFANANRDKYDHFVVFGIGGSSLGGICLQQALTHSFKPNKLHIIDNIDPHWISELEEVIDPARALFIIITKSGTTPETITQYKYFREKAPKENFIFITSNPQVAQNEGLQYFEIHENVGGRFSVLTPVGLLPAALLNLDTKALLRGAQTMRDNFLSTDFNQNLPFQIAAIQYLLYNQGKSINVMMPYAQKLIRFADWYRQLLAESIGKTPEIGITPVNALGVTDQHSQLQLYNDGPNDKLFMFIEISARAEDSSEFSRLMNAELRATRDALTQNSRPNFTITIPEVSAEALGQLFMLMQGAIAFLGEFFNINAFDQPGVELSKVLTKEYLKAKPNH